MPLLAGQRQTIEDVVGLFETGRVGGGDPSAVAVLADGAGISYGVHQATDASDALDAVLLEYIDRGGRLAPQLAPYLPRIAADASAASPQAGWVQDLVAILQAAGQDPIMRAAQAAVFGRLYWDPMALQAESMGLRLPLSWLALYDTAVQSGPGAISRMRMRFREVPPARGGDERLWAAAYIRARARWLSEFVGSHWSHTLLVRRTVYRPMALDELATAGAWTLDRPLRVWGRTLA